MDQANGIWFISTTQNHSAMDFVEVSPSHEDLVHDIAFDFYGKRFATCSSDKHIKIWTLDEEKDSWTSYDIPRAHQNSIWRLSWANPEYGQLLASCSDDNTICLWEEQESTTVSDSSQDRWKKVKLASHKKSVNDVKFCHRSLGLKLASVCADGYLRIYEALDIFDINKWDLLVSFADVGSCVMSLLYFIFSRNLRRSNTKWRTRACLRRITRRRSARPPSMV